MRIRIGPVAALFILLASAAALRFVLLDARELFRDEAASWLLAQSAWADIIPRSSSEPYPPLFAFALKATIGILGDGQAALRALSAVAGLAMVAVTWTWARQAIGVRAAYVAAVLVALSPLALANAREARMYALESLFAVLAWWLLWRLLADRPPGASRQLVVVGAALAVAGELWALPTGVAAFGLQAVVVAVLAWRRQPGTRAASIALAIGFAAFVPWLPRLLSVATDGRPFWTPTPDLPRLLETLAVSFGGWQPSPGWIAVLPLAALAGVGFRTLVRDRQFVPLATALTISASAALVLAWWIASFWRPAYDSRYLGAAVPPLAMAIAVGAERVTARLRRAGWTPRAVGAAGAALLILVGAGTARFEAHWASGEGIEPARAASILLEERVNKGDVVLVADPQTYFPLVYLLERRSRPVELPASLRYWRSGLEPAFVGGDLIPTDHTVEADASLRRGELAGLSSTGSIWLVALTDPAGEVAGFTPLADGRLIEVERLEVVDHGDRGLILRLIPSR
ncbi:MAG: glycosyltransferase family 39 protein [Candidatus Limnocylindria bacterium]